MRYCSFEPGDFPDSQFIDVQGVLMHCPPGGTPHAVGVTPGHSPFETYRLMRNLDGGAPDPATEEQEPRPRGGGQP